MIADIFRILGLIFMGISGLFLVWNGLGVIMAFFIKKKSYPALKKYPQSAILICARNEERVIGNLIQSLKQLDYPKEAYRIFVVAHNCSDQTAKIARKMGAEVIVHNDPSQRKKGDALHVGIDYICKQYPGKYETLTVFDADNVSSPGYLKEANAAIMAGNHVALGLRRSKNRYASPVAQLAGSLFLAVNLGHDLPHTVMKLPMPVAGTGFTFRLDILDEEGWVTDTITEDMEFSLQQMLKHHRIVMAPNAVFYDEQPVDLQDSLKQQLRWGVGRTQCLKKYFLPILRKVPEHPGYMLSALMDLLVNFFLACSVIGVACQILACIFSLDLIAFLLLLGGAVVGYIGAFPVSLLLLIKEKMNIKEERHMILLLPFFYLIPTLFACVSFFKKDAKWRTIEHADQTHMKDLQKKQQD